MACCMHQQQQHLLLLLLQAQSAHVVWVGSLY
jgi:hypothetical protein